MKEIKFYEMLVLSVISKAKEKEKVLVSIEEVAQ